ncbi:hypothetical protein NL676_034226 [Syzygium grande]|nr:hypothetical protein NL676_034226 [Syzygium grande]
MPPPPPPPRKFYVDLLCSLRLSLDLLCSRRLRHRTNHAAAFASASRGKVATDPVAIDAPGGFLLEWWSVLWDIFIARTNAKHSDAAAVYIEVQQLKAITKIIKANSTIACPCYLNGACRMSKVKLTWVQLKSLWPWILHQYMDKQFYNQNQVLFHQRRRRGGCANPRATASKGLASAATTAPWSAATRASPEAVAVASCPAASAPGSVDGQCTCMQQIKDVMTSLGWCVLRCSE